jgi:hypothetical protein
MGQIYGSHLNGLHGRARRVLLPHLSPVVIAASTSAGIALRAMRAVVDADA